MSALPPVPHKGPWTRPPLGDTKPRRRFGGLYRTAEEERAGSTFGGVPLLDAEDAATAAVRLGYKVVDAQIERGRRIARRLSGAAERAGIDNAGVPLEAMERLITNAMLSALQWVEGAAADNASPIKRFATAEFRLLGAMLGLLRDDHEGGGKTPSRHSPRGASRGAAGAPVDPPAGAAPATERRLTACQIRHDGKPGRAVRVVRWDFEGGDVAPGSSSLQFFNSMAPKIKPIEAKLTFQLGVPPVLGVTILARHLPGHWRAAVYAGPVQVGIVEIEI